MTGWRVIGGCTRAWLSTKTVWKSRGGCDFVSRIADCLAFPIWWSRPLEVCLTSGSSVALVVCSVSQGVGWVLWFPLVVVCRSESWAGYLKYYFKSSTPNLLILSRLYFPRFHKSLIVSELRGSTLINGWRSEAARVEQLLYSIALKYWVSVSYEFRETLYQRWASFLFC